MNFGILFLSILFLISQNIFLLNEESLILLCFISFCWFVFNKVKNSIISGFYDQRKSVSDSLKISLISTIETTTKFINLQNFVITIRHQITNLKSYLLLKNSFIIKKSCIYSFNKTKSIFLKKLIFIKRYEQQSNKLLILLLIKKLESVVNLKKFYVNSLELSFFKEFNKILFREYLEILENSKRI